MTIYGTFSAVDLVVNKLLYIYFRCRGYKNIWILLKN